MPGTVFGFVRHSRPFRRAWMVAGGDAAGLAPLTGYGARAQPPFLVVKPKFRSRLRFKPAMRVWIQAWFFTTPM